MVSYHAGRTTREFSSPGLSPLQHHVTRLRFVGLRRRSRGVPELGFRRAGGGRVDTESHDAISKENELMGR